MKRKFAILGAFTLIMVISISGAGATETPTIPAGTILRIKLGTTITSKTSKPGDAFTGQVMADATAGQETVIPEGSLVSGHVAFVKPAGRIKAKAQMRIVLDSIVTPEERKIQLSSTLEDARGGVCGDTSNDEEGTIVGCGKSKKDAAKDAGIAAVAGAGAGSAVGIGHEINCRYYGNCGGPSMGGDILYGAAIGASTALLYNLFKHQKEIILIQGTELTFVVNRTLQGSNSGTPQAMPETNGPAPPPPAPTPGNKLHA